MRIKDNKTKAAVRSDTIRYMRKNYDLYLLLIPAFLFYIIFCYVPMFGVIVAFKDYNIFDGVLKSDWAGLKYFKQMIELPNFTSMVRNTLMLNILSILVGFPAPIILSLMLNELRSTGYKRVAQSLLYLPHFMSWIVLAGIITNLLSPQYGIINHILRSFGFEEIFFMSDKVWWVVVYVLSGVWQSVGWGTIVYMAALTGIDQCLYEAATIDGAGKWKQMLHVTIPGILPTISIMFIMKMGTIVSIGFEQPMALSNSVVTEVSEVISTYSYTAGVRNGQYSVTTAIGLLQSVINMAMILLTNRISWKISGSGLY